MRVSRFLATLVRAFRLSLALSLAGCLVNVAYTARSVAQTQPTPAAQLQEVDGGMAQYGATLLNSTSSSATLQAVTNWNSYVNSRTGWSMPPTLVSRIATAHWGARQRGAPTITPQQLATAATHLINNRLNSMTVSQQQALFQQMYSTHTPKGKIGLSPHYSHITSTLNTNGLWSVVVDPTAFSTMKTDQATLAPGMYNSSSNFYPGEAVVVMYSVATWDMGYGNSYVSKVKTRLGGITGSDLTNQNLFGDNGYLIRRPISTFLTGAALGQFFTELGF